MEKLVSEISNLPQLKLAGSALAEFALTFFAGSKFVAEGGRFVLRPQNFVTFSVHHQRASNITVSLRGNREEFDVRPELALKKDMNGYSLFKLEEPQQLEAAAYYIKRAAELFSRGRTRPLKSPVTIEV